LKSEWPASHKREAEARRGRGVERRICRIRSG
jgi:hypothetical protein